MTMLSVQEAAVLNAAPERVWAFIVTLRYLPLWLGDIKSVQAIADAQASVGTTFTALHHRRHHDESWIVADLSPFHRVRLLAYNHRPEYTFLLDPQAAGTHFTMVYSWPGERGVLDRLLPPTRQRRMVADSLARLEELFRLNRDIKLLHGMGDE